MIFKTRLYAADVAALEDEKLYIKAYNAASPKRREKTDRFIRMKDRRLSLGAELLLMRGLSDLKIKNSALRYGENGKPYLEENEVFFNLSHSGGRVVCAFSASEVGCDVERVKDIELEIARRFFFATEYDTIMAAENRLDTFFRFWTLKESFMKATGQGMSLALDSFRIVTGDNITVEQTYDRNAYYFKEYAIWDGYKSAVCAINDGFEDSARVVEFKELF